MKKRRLHITSTGRWLIIITFPLGIAAANTNNNLLYLIVSMLLTLIIVSGILSETTLRGIRVTRCYPDHIFARRPSLFKWVIENKKRWIPSFSLWIEEIGGNFAPPQYLPKIPPTSSFEKRIPYTFLRRGIYRLKGLKISTRFPFGLFLKQMRIEDGRDVIVYPPIRPLNKRFLWRGGLKEEVTKRGKGRGEGLHSLREYIIGEDSRFIHWKSSARLSRLLFKECEREEGREVIVFLNNLLPQNPSPDFEMQFEGAVEEAASIVYHLLKRGFSVGLWHRGGRIPVSSGTNHLYTILRELALIRAVKETEAKPQPLNKRAMVVRIDLL